MRLWEIIDNAAAARPGEVALVDGDRRLRFVDLADQVHELAAALAPLTSKGDRIAIVADNCTAYVAALYAVPLAGGVLVHGNTRHTSGELTAMFRRCGARVLLATAEQLSRFDADGPNMLVEAGVVHVVCIDDSAGPLSPAAESIDGLAAASTAVPAGDATESDMAWLLYTSGTTGRPKGAMLTHRSVIAAALNTTMARPVAEDEVYLFPFPLFHVAAYNVIHHHLRQRPVVLLPRFEPSAALSIIEAESVTSVSLAPTMLAMLLDHPDRHRHDLSSLRTVSYGAAAMPLDVMRRSLAELPHVGLAQGYGMTELSGNAAFLSPEDHRRAADDDPELLTAAGRPAPMTALRIVDESGAEVEPGAPGEILVSGDQVCAGYYDDPEATAAAIVDGWLHTGDVGRIDRRGYLHVVDRLKDIIITGGENVSSREVEDAVGTHPGVQAVAVVGTPDDKWGELVVAVVVPTRADSVPTVEELRDACRHLAGFKHPRAVLSTDELPTNASGKVDKVAVRKDAARFVGAQSPQG
ncbi:MAG: long-chain fatty acid--CoA ligase [Actinomycetia bacterium]|nr:long-chain fatty acid--CoA ligase [Actinomycetes bacterium]